MQNFATPYFSRDIAEFWRRWHISLSTWFRDYLYIPLGGSRGNLSKNIRNIFIIFVVSGFWHGANWTFIAWGALNAIYFLPLLLIKQNRKNLDVVAQNRWYPTLKEIAQIGITFFFTLIAWVFFRANTIGHAFQYCADLFSGLFDGHSFAIFQEYFTLYDRSLWLLFSGFILIEWVGRKKQFGFEFVQGFNRPLRIISLALVIITTLLFMSSNEQEFIYFQF
jgi:D-alanyl-lipoteichoic acid acyltransferase DltB (MBOAT superfamily)